MTKFSLVRAPRNEPITPTFPDWQEWLKHSKQKPPVFQSHHSGDQRRPILLAFEMIKKFQRGHNFNTSLFTTVIKHVIQNVSRSYHSKILFYFHPYQDLGTIHYYFTIPWRTIYFLWDGLKVSQIWNCIFDGVKTIKGYSKKSGAFYSEQVWINNSAVMHENMNLLHKRNLKFSLF